MTKEQISSKLDDLFDSRALFQIILDNVDTQTEYNDAVKGLDEMETILDNISKRLNNG